MTKLWLAKVGALLRIIHNFKIERTQKSTSRTFPLSRSQIFASSYDGTCIDTIFQNSGECSDIRKWANSCTIRYSITNTGALMMRQLKLTFPLGVHDAHLYFIVSVTEHPL